MIELAPRTHTTTLHHTDVVLNDYGVHHLEAEAHREAVAEWVAEVSEGWFTAKAYTLNYGGVVVRRAGSVQTYIDIYTELGPVVLRHTRVQQGKNLFGIPDHDFSIVRLQSPS